MDWSKETLPLEPLRAPRMVTVPAYRKESRTQGAGGFQAFDLPIRILFPANAMQFLLAI